MEAFEIVEVAGDDLDEFNTRYGGTLSGIGARMVW